MELKPQYVFHQSVNDVTGYSLVSIKPDIYVEEVSNPDISADDQNPEVEVSVVGRVVSLIEAETIWEENPGSLCIVENPLPEGISETDALRYYEPLEHFTALFRIFVSTPTTPTDFVEFANKFGFLADRDDTELDFENVIIPELYGDSTPVHAERLIHWLEQIMRMQEAVTLWDLARVGDIKGLSRYLRWSDGVLGYWTDFPGLQSEFSLIYDTRDPEGQFLDFQDGDVIEPAVFVATSLANSGLEGRVSPRLEMTVEDKTPRLAISPQNLTGAMWLQLARAIDGNRDYRACQRCGSWFEIGGDGYSRARRFCSDRCRVAYSRAQARAKEKDR